jgi:hypothetical protein
MSDETIFKESQQTDPQSASGQKGNIGSALRRKSSKGYRLGKHESDINRLCSQVALSQTEASVIKSLIAQLDSQIENLSTSINGKFENLNIERSWFRGIAIAIVGLGLASLL